ncbi:MAG: glycosyltransferase family 1 protein, partial [Mesorhizobium sp.]
SGNMRCFEAMGAGALLLTDAGNYPPGMVDGRAMSVYADAKVAVGLIEKSLSDGSWRNIAAASHSMIRSEYSKEKQMEKFLTFV